EQGRLITLEGVEGVGKTSALREIAAFLEQHAVDFIVTREPGGTPMAEAIRNTLLAAQEEKVDPYTELLLMFAARRQHIQTVIAPALAQGQWVVSDRFTDASFAYQGGGRGIELSHIQTLADWVQGDVKPHLTLLLDAPIAVAMRRLRHRQHDRIEQAPLAFFERVRQTYLELARAQAERFVVIDASKDLPEVQKALHQALRTRLPLGATDAP
ncbi:unnamed protein product, partial [marine sediment metagenome]